MPATWLCFFCANNFAYLCFVLCLVVNGGQLGGEREQGSVVCVLVFVLLLYAATTFLLKQCGAAGVVPSGVPFAAGR